MENLREAWQTALAQQDRLPGWEACFAKEPKIKPWIESLEERVQNAIRDEDRVHFEKELGALVKAWNRVNELIAEEYRAEHPDPADWELRYVKWMKLVYIKFDSPLGEFCLVPRPPRRQPKVDTWYTVDEMQALLRPEIAEFIKSVGVLPKRPEGLKPPGPGEQVIRIGPEGTKIERGKG